MDDTVDLEQPIIDAVGLALPFVAAVWTRLRRPVSECGVPLATAEPGHQHEQIDPRWAKLSGMFDEEDT